MLCTHFNNASNTDIRAVEYVGFCHPLALSSRGGGVCVRREPDS